MRKSNFIILFITAAVIVLLAVFARWMERKSISSDEMSLGEKPLKDLPVNDFTRIALYRGDKPEVMLIKDEDSWKLANRGGYPANFAKIRDFLRSLIDVRIKQVADIPSSRFEAVGFAGDEAVKLVLSRNAKDAGMEIIFGANHIREVASEEFGLQRRPDGRYVHIPGENLSFVTDSMFYDLSSPDASDWLKKDFAGIEKPESIKLTDEDGETLWALAAGEDGKLAPVPAPQEGTVNKSKVSSVRNRLSSLSFEDVVAANEKTLAETGLDNAKLLVAASDKKKLSLSIGKKEKSYYFVKVDVEYLDKEKSSAKEKASAEDESERAEDTAGKTETPEKEKPEMDFSRWIYLVNDYIIDDFTADAPDFINLPENKTGQDKNSGNPGNPE